MLTHSVAAKTGNGLLIKEKKMGRPLKTAKTVAGTNKQGSIGPTARTGAQILVSARPAAAAAADGFITRQKSSRRFTCSNSDGVATLRLVTTAPAQGECRITATDSAGGTYFIRKLNSKTATLVRGTGTLFATGQKARWTFTAAVANSTVQLANA